METWRDQCYENPRSNFIGFYWGYSYYRSSGFAIQKISKGLRRGIPSVCEYESLVLVVECEVMCIIILLMS